MLDTSVEWGLQLNDIWGMIIWCIACIFTKRINIFGAFVDGLDRVKIVNRYEVWLLSHPDIVFFRCVVYSMSVYKGLCACLCLESGYCPCLILKAVSTTLISVTKRPYWPDSCSNFRLTSGTSLRWRKRAGWFIPVCYRVFLNCPRIWNETEIKQFWNVSAVLANHKSVSAVYVKTTAYPAVKRTLIDKHGGWRPNHVRH